jgi:hypothetical protein
VAGPPQYSESVDDVDSLHSEALSARVVTAKYISPGHVHLEIVPINAIRYENTSDEFPRRSSQ